MPKRRSSERIYKIAIIDAVRRGVAKEESKPSAAPPIDSDKDAAANKSNQEGTET